MSYVCVIIFKLYHKINEWKQKIIVTNYYHRFIFSFYWFYFFFLKAYFNYNYFCFFCYYILVNEFTLGVSSPFLSVMFFLLWDLDLDLDFFDLLEIEECYDRF